MTAKIMPRALLLLISLATPLATQFSDSVTEEVNTKRAWLSRSAIIGTYKIAVVHVLLHTMVLSHYQKSFEMSYRWVLIRPLFKIFVFFDKFFLRKSRFLIRIICPQPTFSLNNPIYVKGGIEKNWNETRFVSREKDRN